MIVELSYCVYVVCEYRRYDYLHQKPKKVSKSKGIRIFRQTTHYWALLTGRNIQTNRVG